MIGAAELRQGREVHEQTIALRSSIPTGRRSSGSTPRCPSRAFRRGACGRRVGRQQGSGNFPEALGRRRCAIPRRVSNRQDNGRCWAWRTRPKGRRGSAAIKSRPAGDPDRTTRGVSAMAAEVNRRAPWRRGTQLLRRGMLVAWVPPSCTTIPRLNSRRSKKFHQPSGWISRGRSTGRGGVALSFLKRAVLEQTRCNDQGPRRACVPIVHFRSGREQPSCWGVLRLRPWKQARHHCAQTRSG